MSVIAFIPVRCGSKSIPFKNIKILCGKPLVYWTVNALQQCEKIDEIYVATDCDKIETIVADLNLPKVKIYRRSPENAQDASSTESVMLEFINSRKINEDTDFILAQATSPLTSTANYSEALDMYFNGDYNSILTCVRLKKFFWNDNGTPMNYDYLNRPRRQDFNGVLTENGAFYINKVANILKNKNRLSGKIGIYEMPEYSVVDLDEPDDWIVAETLMKKYIV